MIKRDNSPGENCSLCNREIPKNMVVLRKMEGGRCICILCLVEIAEVAQQELPKVNQAKDN